MATYKLIQDIEAEDHVLGPLSFRQFVFALIAVFFGYMTFIVITKNLAILALVFAPPALFFGFFALPFGRDQPTEIWALAKLRFLFKPRRRVWDQSGQKELVTINVPKKVEHIYTDGLSQTEVKSRLNALANTLDSRGWAVKNTVGVQPAIVVESDRLVGLNVQNQEVPDIDVRASDDVLDSTANPLAQQFTDMIDASTQAHRQRIIDEMNNIRAGEQQVTNSSPVAQPTTNGYQPAAASDWFMPQQATNQAPGMMQTSETPEEQALIAQIQAKAAAQQAAQTNMRTIPADNTQPLDDSSSYIGTATQDLTAQQTFADQPLDNPVGSQQSASASTSDPAILTLAHNDDLNIATLAREADKAKGGSPDEVVISLH